MAVVESLHKPNLCDLQYNTVISINNSHGALVVTLTWYSNVTVVYPLADSYVQVAAWEAGEAVEIAAARKFIKYAELENRYIF